MRSCPEILRLCTSMHFKFPGAVSVFLSVVNRWVLPAPRSQVLQPAAPQPHVRARRITSDKNNEQVIAKSISQEQLWFLQPGLAHGGVCRGIAAPALRRLPGQPHLANLTQLHTIMVVSVSQGQVTATRQGNSPLKIFSGGV